MMKRLTQILLCTLLTIRCVHGQLNINTNILAAKPMLSITPLGGSPYAEVYNACDQQVLQSDFRNGRCREAVPPLNAGDGLINQSACVSLLTNTSCTLIAHPNRPRIVDKDGNTVAIKNEVLAGAAYFFARDKSTLEGVLQTTSIQVLTPNGWVTKFLLNATNYLPPSNERSYRFWDCGKAAAQFGKDWATFQRLDTIAHAALGANNPTIGSPRPSPDTYLKGMPGDPASPLQPNSPLASGSDEAMLRDMRDAAIQKTLKDADAMAAASQQGCTNKTLPYYWTLVTFAHSLDVGDTQLRLHVASAAVSIKDYVVSLPFRTYAAAASQFTMLANAGNRDFSCQIFAAGETDLGQNVVSLVYNEGTLSSDHRTPIASSGTPYVWTINGRGVKQLGAKGRLPFQKQFWDDSVFKDISQTASQPGDVAPLVVKGGGTIAYRLEVNPGGFAFVSQPATSIMPRLLTIAMMGDSFSAGQGSPFLSSTEGPWLNDDCHQSRWSGQYRAVNRFIRDSNKACDYVFVACEGASIQDLFDQAQGTKHNPDGTTKRNSDGTIDGELKQQKPQVDLVADWMSNRGYSYLDVALFSIGGNNVGFADIIEAALITPWDGTQDQKLRDQVDAGFTLIGGVNGYQKLDKALKDKLKVKNVIIFGYPDLVHGPNGVCASDCPLPKSPLNTISISELQFGASLTTRLNNAVQSGGQLPGWRYVDIFAATSGHGICVCDDPYFTTWTAATGDSALGGVGPTPITIPCARGKGSLSWLPFFGKNLGPDGASCSFHPSPKGYEQYIGPILTNLTALYGN